MLKVSLLDRCLYGREGSERLRDFSENVPEYLTRANAGENPYKLEIDQEWANFIYESSKMTWKKLIFILIAIAPSFSKVLSFFTTKPIISGCAKRIEFLSGGEQMDLSECIKYNGNSVYLKFALTTDSFKDIFNPLILVFMIFLMLPHLYFVFAFWNRFSINKYSVWISAAKIQLTTQEKRNLTCRYYMALIGTVISALISSFFMYIITLIRILGGASVPYDSETKARVYFNSEIDSFSFFISPMLVYTCLFTVLFSNIREPTLLFTGFRNYLKKASHVAYNTATVNYRIQRNDLYWKFIQKYYEQCKNYDRHIVLIALTTHFLDLGMLEIEGSNAMLDSARTDKTA